MEQNCRSSEPYCSKRHVIMRAGLCLILLLLVKHMKRQKLRILDEESLPHGCKLSLDEKTNSSFVTERRAPNVPDIVMVWRKNVVASSYRSCSASTMASSDIDAKKPGCFLSSSVRMEGVLIPPEVWPRRLKRVPGKLN